MRPLVYAVRNDFEPVAQLRHETTDLLQILRANTFTRLQMYKKNSVV
jgi:hypothetical protein